MLGLLRGCKHIKEIAEKGLLPYGKSYSCQLLATDEAPHQHTLAYYLPIALAGSYLVVDLFTVSITREGRSMEGIGRRFNSTAQGRFSDHNLTTGVPSCVRTPSNNAS